MALRGTLDNFGIADAWQLLGAQGKTGTLRVHHGEHEVHVHFADGHVVGVAHLGAGNDDALLATVLVQGEVLSPRKLKRAYRAQSKTGETLSEVLVRLRLVDEEVLHEINRVLQADTLYGMFGWRSGTYEFHQGDVPQASSGMGWRSEKALMEGFRQAEHWPELRRKIPDFTVSFRIVADIATKRALAQDRGQGQTQSHAQTHTQTNERDDGGDRTLDAGAEEGLGGLDLDAAFADLGADDETSSGTLGDGSLGSAHGAAPAATLGDDERRVYECVGRGRDVRKIIALSRLGSYGTCAALVRLLEAGCIEVDDTVRPKRARKARRSHPPQPPHAAVIAERRTRPIRISVGSSPAWVRNSLQLVLWAGAGFGVWLTQSGWLPGPAAGGAAAGAWAAADVRHGLMPNHMRRLHEALAVYHAETGEYPLELRQLVKAGLIAESDLSFPWHQPYAYARQDEGYRLAAPDAQFGMQDSGWSGGEQDPAKGRRSW